MYSLYTINIHITMDPVWLAVSWFYKTLGQPNILQIYYIKQDTKLYFPLSLKTTSHLSFPKSH